MESSADYLPSMLKMKVKTLDKEQTIGRRSLADLLKFVFSWFERTKS